MMMIDVASADLLLGEARKFSFTVTASSLDLGEDISSYRGKVRVEGAVVDTGAVYRVIGTIWAVRNFICDRCLADGRVRVIFLRTMRRPRGKQMGREVVMVKPSFLTILCAIPSLWLSRCVSFVSLTVRVYAQSVGIT